MRFVAKAGMSSHRFQPEFVSPQLLNRLQEIFDTAWQEISALGSNGVEGASANRLRSELAKTIMSARSVEPTLIAETVLQKIRTRKLGRPGL